MSNQEIREIGPEYHGIIVECPFCQNEPDPNHALPLAVFIATELGKSVLAPLVENAELLQSGGAGLNDAINEAFGEYAHRNEDGEITIASEDQVIEQKKIFTIDKLIELHKDQDGFETSSGGPVKNEATIQNDNQPSLDSFTYTETDGIMQVVGEVTNNGTQPEPIEIRATFYDENSNVLGTAFGKITGLKPGETSSFTLVTNDNVSGYKDLDVRIEKTI